MARPKLTDEGVGKPICVRLNESLIQQLELASRKLDIPASEVMRLCMRIGMEHFKRIDFDTAKCIVEAVEAKRPAENIISLRKPVQYTTGQGGSSPARRIAEEHDKDNNEP